MAKTSTSDTKPARSLKKKPFASAAQIQAYLLAREAVRRACNAAAGGKTTVRQDAR